VQSDWQLSTDKVYHKSDKFCPGVTQAGYNDFHIIVVFVV